MLGAINPMGKTVERERPTDTEGERERDSNEDRERQRNFLQTKIDMVYPILGNHKFQRDGWTEGGREGWRERERERERKDSRERENQESENSKTLILKDNRDRTVRIM